MLPVPYAFSKTGVLLGVLVMIVVAGSNCLTSLLLLKAAGKTGCNSYEGVALAVGGQTWKVRATANASVYCALHHALICLHQNTHHWLLQQKMQATQLAVLHMSSDINFAVAGSHTSQPVTAVVWNNCGRLCPHIRRVSQGFQRLGSTIRASSMACCL